MLHIPRDVECGPALNKVCVVSLDPVVYTPKGVCGHVHACAYVCVCTRASVCACVHACKCVCVCVSSMSGVRDKVLGRIATGTHTHTVGSGLATDFLFVCS